MVDGVSRADVDAVVGLAEELALASTPDELAVKTVELLPTLVPAVSVTWNEVDERNHRMNVVTPDDFDSSRRATWDEAFLSYMAEHPVINHVRRTRDGRPAAISDFLTEEQFHATGLYRHLYSRLHTEDQLSFVLPDPDLLIGVAVNRSTRGFDARDRMVCNLIRPHLLQLYRHTTILAAYRRAAEGLDDGPMDEQDAVVVIGPGGYIEHATGSARELLHHFGGFDGPDNATLDRWTHGATTSSLGPGWPAIQRQGDERLAIRQMEVETRTVLLLSKQTDSGTSERLGRLGLTDREREVLVLVADGLSSKQIAGRLTVRPRTVDKHVLNALRKLGVRTRLEAVALLSEHWRRPGGNSATDEPQQ